MLKALKKKMKDQRGLTLIELLAVIVILGIIAGIAVPSIGGIINKTERDAQVAEAIQIINAAKLAHSSNSAIITWTHDGANSTGALDEFLSNVEDQEYTVNYDATEREYSIVGHDASGVISNVATAGTLTEEELLDYSN